jgi:hypothetical protein
MRPGGPIGKHHRLNGMAASNAEPTGICRNHGIQCFTDCVDLQDDFVFIEEPLAFRKNMNY